MCPISNIQLSSRSYVQYMFCYMHTWNMENNECPRYFSLSIRRTKWSIIWKCTITMIHTYINIYFELKTRCLIWLIRLHSSFVNTLSCRWKWKRYETKETNTSAVSSVQRFSNILVIGQIPAEKITLSDRCFGFAYKLTKYSPCLKICFQILFRICIIHCYVIWMMWSHWVTR